MSLISIVPALVFGAFLPSLAKRVDKFRIFFAACLASSAMGVIMYFVGCQNIALYFAFSFLRYIPFGITLFMMFMFTPDCVEYGLYRTGINASGIAFSIQTFTAKFMTALGTAAGAFVLAAIGYIESEGAAQLPGFEDRLWLAQTIVPALGSLLSIPFLAAYKLRDKFVQVMAKANSGEISREEADRQYAGQHH
jgi:Na+/melibiose symporter-like transporter